MGAQILPAVCHLASVDVRSMADWISAIPFEEWPQQTRLPDGKLRPAMVNDLEWPRDRPADDRFITRAADVVFTTRNRLEAIKRAGSTLRLANHMLSVVMPGHSIPPHGDRQEPGWVTRVHVPLLTNPMAAFVFPEEPPGYRVWTMQAGEAYMVDVARVHEVRNEGPTPRVHFMFDVFQGQ
jgi:hypothetical protein